MKLQNYILAALLMAPIVAVAQPTPVAPATQAEVNAGTVHTKYVAPDTLLGGVRAGGAVTNGQAGVTLNSPFYTQQINHESTTPVNISGSVPLYINGNPSHWSAFGDGVLWTANMSTNPLSSGSGFSCATIGIVGGIPTVIGTVDYEFLLVPTNALRSLDPGWANIPLNIGPNVKGFAITVTGSIPGGFAAGNYPYFLIDMRLNSNMVYFPKFTDGGYTPETNSFRSALSINPVSGQVTAYDKFAVTNASAMRVGLNADASGGRSPFNADGSFNFTGSAANSTENITQGVNASNFVSQAAYATFSGTTVNGQPSFSTRGNGVTLFDDQFGGVLGVSSTAYFRWGWNTGTFDVNADFNDWTDNTHTLGTSALRWKAVNAVTLATTRSNLLAPAAITLTGSPFSWTNSAVGSVFVIADGGTAFSIAINGTTVMSGLAGGLTVPLQPNEYVTFTYTVAPSAFSKPY